MPRSARAVERRLALWNLGVLACVVAIVVGVAYAIERRASDAALDQDLERGAERAAARLAHRYEEAKEGHDDDDDDDAIPGDAQELLVLERRAGSREGWSNRRALPPGLPDERGFAEALAGRRASAELPAGESPIRLLTVPVRHDGRVIGAVQVGKSTAEVRRALGRTLGVLGVTGMLGLLCAASGSIFLARRAMRPITQALARQRRFVADASHELRTPVAVLRARADQLAAEPLATSDEIAGARAALSQLRKDADELSTLLTELLDLARLDADQLALRIQAIPASDVVEELVEQLGPLASERGVSLRAEGGLAFASADLARTRQALRALVDNAIVHTPPGGRITVSARAERGRVQLAVADTGPGIAPEDLPHLFDRFYRADAARTRDPRRGAGLGLAIASELVAAMGGTIHVDAAPGRGSTFVIELPAAPPISS